MPFVLDTSVALVWCFEDEQSLYAADVLDQLANDTALVPVIWLLEIANVLANAERRGWITPAKSARFVQLIGGLMIEVESASLEQTLTSVLNIARDYGLTSYDASYLELAMRWGSPLATQDVGLRSAAAHAGVPLFLQ